MSSDGSVAAPPIQVIVLCGLTGSGKSDLLRALAELGEQTLDLEELARHRGSAFGGLALDPQPSHARFQAAVRATWLSRDHSRPLSIEEKGEYLGSVGLPDEILAVLRRCPTVEVSRTRDDRIRALLDTYGDSPVEHWRRCVGRISLRLGAQRCERVLALLRDTVTAEAVGALLDYYDHAYTHRRASSDRPLLGTVGPEPDDATSRAALALALATAGQTPLRPTAVVKPTIEVIDT